MHLATSTVYINFCYVRYYAGLSNSDTAPLQAQKRKKNSLGTVLELTVGVQGYCVPGCAENVIGITFYKYILTNVVSINGVEVLMAIGKKCLHMESYIDPPWVSLPLTEM